jgi:hypothetical protein
METLMDRPSGFRYRLVGVITVVACCPPPALLGQSNPCLTAEPRAEAFINGLRQQYEDIGADSTAWQAHGAPFATGSAITLVTDSTTCAAALTAYNTASGRAGTDDAATQVYVARIGTTEYVVMTTQRASGEWVTLYFFDSDWHLKDSLLG